MQPVKAPREALERAKGYLEEIRDSENAPELAEHWLSLLHALQRCWNKAEAGYGKSPKWHQIHGKILQRRKQDAVLTYMLHARNADEHGIESVTSQQDGSIAIGGNGHVKSFELFADGSFQMDATPGITVTFTPARIMAVAVKDRGQMYAPPAHSSVLELGEHAIRFYEVALAEIDALLVSE